MIEVELANIKENLINGNFISHISPNKYRSSAEHLFDEDWRVFHYKDEVFQQVDDNKVKELLSRVIQETEERKEKTVKIESLEG